MERAFFFIFFLSAFVVCFTGSLVSALDVSHDGRALVFNGERKIVISGSIHYPRSTPEMWPDLIQKAKEGGLDAIETYVFWNVHEPQKRQYNFEGNLDFIRFLKEVQNAGLYAVLRIGPYVCGEWNYGGFPVWLHQIPGLVVRTDNAAFEYEMQNFTTLIVNMVKQERLFASQGGPIIIAQIENEYGNIMGPYGDAGKKYIQWCANLAESLDIGVPWIMCQQDDAPQPMINTHNYFYFDNFQPNNPNDPKMWTENWTGWFKKWDLSTPHRPAEDLAYSVARMFQQGGSFQNYYMYHGGTNFGRTAGGPYIITSYDYDAPLDEYGNLRQPKWGHLKELHAAIKLMEKALTHGDVINSDYGNGVLATQYIGNGTAAPGCFLVNKNTSSDATVDFEGNQYFVPAWSVSILPDCKNEVYNTAKITTQTSVMTTQLSGDENSTSELTWLWRPEHIKDTLTGKGSFTANSLLEQIITTGDASDYLWYMTSVNFTKKDNMILRVNTTGHVLYAFVNGKLVGSQYGTSSNVRFVFEQPNITVKPGKNYITLLSATVGLSNYGAYFDSYPAGIAGGPVQLISSQNVTTDLSTNLWSYKIGLDGEAKQIYLDNPSQQNMKWYSDVIPTKRPFTWYKATFEAPMGTDSVVVDLHGMGKGAAWVNGHNIGRFWPMYKAPADGCGKCDYRGIFDGDRTLCRTDCGKSSQRWYHIPRSFLKPGHPNTIVLFEESGGDPAQINFQTVTVGTVCAEVPEGKTLTLSCQGSQVISKIDYASFGDPQGTCAFVGEPYGTYGSFVNGSCESAEAQSVVEQECLGKLSCSIDASEDTLGESNCGNMINRLAVRAFCGADSVGGP